MKLRLKAISEWFSSVVRYVLDRKEAIRKFEKAVKYIIIFTGLAMIAVSNGALEYESSRWQPSELNPTSWSKAAFGEMAQELQTLALVLVLLAGAKLWGRRLDRQEAEAIARLEREENNSDADTAASEGT